MVLTGVGFPLKWDAKLTGPNTNIIAAGTQERGLGGARPWKLGERPGELGLGLLRRGHCLCGAGPSEHASAMGLLWGILKDAGNCN